jgi:TolB-like protein
MKTYKLLVVVLLSVLLGGCYSFRGQTAGNIKSIAIPPFENETSEFGLAERVTDELIRAFQKDGVLRISNADQADAILRGRLVRVDNLPYSASSGQNITVEEYRFSMSCEIEMIDNHTQAVLWSQPYSASAIYAYDNSLDKRDVAIQEAVNKLQQDLVNRIVGSW